MITDEISFLVGQCEDFYSAFLTSISSNEDEESLLENFLVDFFTGANNFKLVTKSELDSVVQTFITREVLETFVLSLRFSALGSLDKDSVDRIVQAFATANANSTSRSDATRFTALPKDADSWLVKKEDLVELYHANLWIIPLLALAFLFKRKIEGTLGK